MGFVENKLHGEAQLRQEFEAPKSNRKPAHTTAAPELHRASRALRRAPRTSA